MSLRRVGAEAVLETRDGQFVTGTAWPKELNENDWLALSQITRARDSHLP
jgi:hypothetical protein